MSENKSRGWTAEPPVAPGWYWVRSRQNRALCWVGQAVLVYENLWLLRGTVEVCLLSRECPDHSSDYEFGVEPIPQIDPAVEVAL